MILFPAIIIFLFSLYILSKDDFVFLRKNISQVQLFDIAFLAGAVALFFSRLVYVLSHYSPLFLNPLVFLVIPYFPGLSLAGALLGGTLTVYLLTIRQKVPMGRVFDIFALALLIAMTAAFFGYSLEQVVRKSYIIAAGYGIFAVLFLVAYISIRAIFLKSSWKDGSIAQLIFVIISCAVTVGQEISLQFRTFSSELPYFVLFLLVLLIAFLFRKVRKARERT